MALYLSLTRARGLRLLSFGFRGKMIYEEKPFAHRRRKRHVINNYYIIIIILKELHFAKLMFYAYCSGLFSFEIQTKH